MYALEPACVVFGIGNSLGLFGRKQHCAELVHTQRRATPARQLTVNGHAVATGKCPLSRGELVPTLPNTPIVLLLPPLPCSRPMPPTHSSLDMQGDIIHSLNEHAIYGTHTSCQRMRHCHIVSNRGSQRGGPAGIPPRKPVSLPGAGIMGKYVSVISGLKWLQQMWLPRRLHVSIRLAQPVIYEIYEFRW